MKLKRITKPEEIRPWKVYLETLQNHHPDTVLAQNVIMIYESDSVAYEYKSENSSLNGNLVFNACYVWPDNSKSETNCQFLGDVGIMHNDEKPHNNHKLYEVLESTDPWKDVGEMTLKELEFLVQLY